ncbi:MAG: carboxylating nicotinate-nucleotide diphosphorylase [Clostridia bacterium]|nr:carboxylating nicotinate-nucleotide diphosphorylase [Clostridia bacterium]
MFYYDNPLVDSIINLALNEDIGSGDITTVSTIPVDKSATGKFIAKEEMVICGIDLADHIFKKFDSSVIFTPHFKDGNALQKGDVIAEVEGNARTLLVCERTVLNFMQHLSGIASKTAKAVKSVEGTKAKITDTRKTTPGVRALEKYAIRVGGGTNHRFNLASGVLIKDNHIAVSGGIKKAVENARKMIPHTLKIEVEVETIEQLMEALEAKADIIMLDNMPNDLMSECVKIASGRAIIEASGNMGEKDLREVAATGVDIISIGALTHSVKAADISLKFKIS